MLKNSTVLEKAWLEGSTDYQQRIPNMQISGYAQHVAALFDPMNNDLFNQFSGLLNGLMGTYIESKLFENPLRVLKKPAAEWGNSERHVAVKYMQAHTYAPNTETLMKLEKPEFVEWFYSVTEPRRYEFSWSRYEMMRAFAEPDGYGFDELLSATISQAYSSDNYDEMQIMINCFAEADARMGGLYRENLSAAPTDLATSKELLTKVRAIAGRMKFPTMLYNHIPVPVFETPETLVFWVTPEVDAVLDVQALAELFNVERAEVRYRKIIIPEFPLPNVYAALTSEDFIYARDVWYGMEPPFYNPETMTYKHYLQHAEIIGVNPAANAVLFTTDAQTVIPTVEVETVGLIFTPNTYEVGIGKTVKLNLDLIGSIAVGEDDYNGKIGVEPDAAIYSVSAIRGTGADATAIPLNSRTYVDNYGVLHVQKTGLEADDVITVTATSVYTNPSGQTPAYTATATVTVVEPEETPEKECVVETEPFITYTDETTEVTASE